MPVPTKRTFEDYYPGYDAGDEPFELRVAHHNLGTVTSSGNYFMLVAPTNIRVTKIRVTVDAAIDVSTSAYWSLQLANMTRGCDLLSTADNLNYDTALVADSVYEITPDQATYVTEDDVLELQLTETGSATNLGGLLVEVEYVVTGVVTTTSTSTTTSTTTTTTTTTT